MQVALQQNHENVKLQFLISHTYIVTLRKVYYFVYLIFRVLYSLLQISHERCGLIAFRRIHVHHAFVFKLDAFLAHFIIITLQVEQNPNISINV